MADYTVRRIGDMDAGYGGAFKRARAELGVESFGMAIIDFPPSADRYPRHDHSEDGQEEVYLLLSGSAEIEIDGETVPLDPETVVRVGPGTSRKIRTTGEPARILAIGGTPGRVYEAPDWTRIGDSDPTLR